MIADSAIMLIVSPMQATRSLAGFCIRSTGLRIIGLNGRRMVMMAARLRAGVRMAGVSVSPFTADVRMAKRMVSPQWHRANAGDDQCYPASELSEKNHVAPEKGLDVVGTRTPLVQGHRFPCHRVPHSPAVLVSPLSTGKSRQTQLAQVLKRGDLFAQPARRNEPHW